MGTCSTVTTGCWPAPPSWTRPALPLTVTATDLPGRADLHRRQVDEPAPAPGRGDVVQANKDSRPLRRTRWTKRPRLTRERDEHLRPALRAAQSGEAALVDAAVEVAQNLRVEETPPPPEPRFEAVFPQALDLVVVPLDEAVQGRRARRARSVQGGSGAVGRQRLAPLRNQCGPRPLPSSRASTRSRSCE